MAARTRLMELPGSSEQEERLGQRAWACRRRPLAAVGIAVFGVAALTLAGLSSQRQSRVAPRTDSGLRVTGLDDSLKARVEHFDVSGNVITLPDAEDPCVTYPYLKFKKVLYNNLGNVGPDSGAGEGLVWDTVDLGAGAGIELNHQIMITVNATSGNYQAFSPRMNGLQGAYGSINLNSGSSVDLEMKFWERRSGKQISIPEAAFTFFDLDEGGGHSSSESVTVAGFDSYHLTKETEVKVHDIGGGYKKFQASTMGTGEDNPTNPQALNEQQQNRAVTLLMHNVHKLDVKLMATAGSGPRFFTFVGRPSLLCGVTVQAGFKPPLNDLIAVPPLERAVCVGKGETFDSWLCKEGDTVVAGQELFKTRGPDNSVNTYSVFFAGTVSQTQSKLKRGDKLDDRLANNTVVVVELPLYDPLSVGSDISSAGPVDPDAWATDGTISSDESKENVCGNHATFKEYLVGKGDVVRAGDHFAVIYHHDAEVMLQSQATGVVDSLQPLKRGDYLVQVKSGALMTVSKFKPLPVNPPEEEPAVFAGGEGATFVRYLVKEGDEVEADDPIAVLKVAGKESTVLSPRPGGVKCIQNFLEEGMLIDKVMQDKNFATIGQMSALPVSDTEEGAFGPESSKWVFEEMEAAQGDVVAKGAPIAVLKNTEDSSTTEIYAPKPGRVDATQNLTKGDVVVEVVEDTDLATIGQIPEPEVRWMQSGVSVPDMDVIFERYLVNVGDYVHVGQGLAEVRKGAPAGSSGRRLAGDLITIPSPSTGTVNYLAPLEPGKSIRNQCVGPKIARLALGLPWWLVLLGSLGVLGSIMCCLHAVMEKPKPAYKKMPVTEPKPEPAPAPPVVVPPPAPTPEGLRLDFSDSGAIKTTYAKWRPLGIKHDFTAPIVATSFTINSYAKTELGVQTGWKLTRIGKEELNDNSNFSEVEGKLASHMKDFKLWPLPIEFKTKEESNQVILKKFTEKPIGMEFANKAPIEVSKVHPGSPAAELGVQLGWIVTKIGEMDVHETTDFREVMKYLKEGVDALEDSGKTYTTSQPGSPKAGSLSPKAGGRSP